MFRYLGGSHGGNVKRPNTATLWDARPCAGRGDIVVIMPRMHAWPLHMEIAAVDVVVPHAPAASSYVAAAACVTGAAAVQNVYLSVAMIM